MERAGADLNFVKGELQGLGKELGLSGHDSKAILRFPREENGHVSSTRCATSAEIGRRRQGLQPR